MESHRPSNNGQVKPPKRNVQSHILILETAGRTKVVTSWTSPFVDSLVQRLRQVSGLSDSSVGVDEQFPPVVEGQGLPGILLGLGVNERDLGEEVIR